MIDEQFVIQKVPIIDLKNCTFCGKCQKFCNYNAIIVIPEIKRIQVIEELCHDCGACSFACKFSAITEKDKTIGTISIFELDKYSVLLESRLNIGVYSSVPLIKSAISAVDNETIALFDAPPGTSCPFIASVEDADYVVLVTEPTPFGLNDLKLSVNTLKELRKSFGVVINRVGIGNNDVFNYLKENQIPLLAEIPFDREIARNYSEGKLITQALPQYQEVFEQLYFTIQNIN